VHGVEITRAVRDSSADGKEIKEGDVIGIVDGKITEVGGEFLPVIEGVLNAQPQPPELVTVYRGGEVTEAEAEALLSTLRGEYPKTEFELHVGGQDHYPYVLSIE
jgi:dihydroxyacetone kinase-like predicted kinase